MSRQIIWQYGTTGVSGSGDNQLNHPWDASPLANGNILITDYYNHRVIEVDRDRQIIWQYGTSGASGSGDNQLNHPWSASPLANGNILIADRYNHRVIEVDR
jgi:outer membrane protein assembly factor BamB